MTNVVYLPFFFLGSLRLFGLQHRSLEVVDPRASPDQFRPKKKTLILVKMITKCLLLR
jgi:hypothetical protein